MQRITVVVSGRVQGVTYRASAQKAAKKLGLTGWVQNLADGRVKLVAEGDAATLDEMIAWTHRGPIFARVDDVDVVRSDATQEFTEFEVRR